jgi:hypothetical protein
LVGILVSDQNARFGIDPSEQHEFIGEPKAIQESGFDITVLVCGFVKHGGHESVETVGLARPQKRSVTQRLKQHPHWEELLARWVDSSVHQATLLAGCHAERWNSQ